MESFTMSVDRGFLGRVPGEHGTIYRSMENLSAQKATGLELVRLLRVCLNLSATLVNKVELESIFNGRRLNSPDLPPKTSRCL